MFGCGNNAVALSQYRGVKSTFNVLKVGGNGKIALIGANKSDANLRAGLKSDINLTTTMQANATDLHGTDQCAKTSLHEL
jgi:hypothetical protein